MYNNQYIKAKILKNLNSFSSILIGMQYNKALDTLLHWYLHHCTIQFIRIEYLKLDSKE